MRKLPITLAAGLAALTAAGCSSGGTVDVSVSSSELHAVPACPRARGSR